MTWAAELCCGIGVVVAIRGEKSADRVGTMAKLWGARSLRKLESGSTGYYYPLLW